MLKDSSWKNKIMIFFHSQFNYKKKLNHKQLMNKKASKKKRQIISMLFIEIMQLITTSYTKTVMMVVEMAVFLFHLLFFFVHIKTFLLFIN